MTLEAWLNWFYLVHHVIESSNWSLVLFSSNVKSKQWSPSTTTYKCLILVVMICWKYLMACKFIWVESCFGWKIILHIGKWVKCHWLLKNDLKTSTYDIWFLCILFVSFFWFFEAILSHLWVFMILLVLFLNSYCNLFIWVFGRFSCKIWDF